MALQDWQDVALGDIYNPLEVTQYNWLHAFSPIRQNAIQEAYSIQQAYAAGSQAAQRNFPAPVNDEFFWIVFFDNNNINNAWEAAKRLYYNGSLVNVWRVLCATAKQSPNAAGPDKKPILFWYGGPNDPDLIDNCGRNILRQMNHTKQNCDHQYEEATGLTACIHLKSEPQGESMRRIEIPDDD